MAVRRFPLRGDVDLSTVADLQIKLDVLISATDDDIVLDCAELTFIDSTGIGMFVHVQRALEVQGRKCELPDVEGKAAHEREDRHDNHNDRKDSLADSRAPCLRRGGGSSTLCHARRE